MSKAGGPRAIFLNSGALENAYRLYWKELCNYLNKRFGEGPPEPEDVAQQAFEKYAALDDPASVRHPRAFLYRTATNLVADHYRSAAVRTAVSFDGVDLDVAPALRDEITPEIVLIDKRRYERVMAALAALPRRQRRFLILHRLRGMTYNEIAQRNGVSISTAEREVKAAVNASREALFAMENNE